MDFATSWTAPIILVGLIAGLGWFAGRRTERPQKPEPSADAIDSDRSVITVDGFGNMTLSPQASALLGFETDGRFSADQFFTRLGARCASLRAAIRKLLSDGLPFDEVFETAEGAFVQAMGRAKGTRAIIEFKDQTGLITRAREAERELDAALRDLADLREAMGFYGVACWRKRSSASGVWDEISESAIAGDQQQRIIAASEVSGTRRVDASSSPSGAGSTYQVSYLDRDRSLVAARRIDDVVGTETLMNRLVHTMSETFAHLSVGLMIFDSRNRLTLFNPAIIEIFDERADWLATRPRLGEVLDLWRRNGKLPERLDYAAWKEQLLAVGKDGDETPLEEKWHLPDGRSLRVFCRQHPSGGLAIVVEDITEAVSLIRDTASERAVRSATTEILNEGLLVVGPDNRIRMMNAAFRRVWGLEDVSATPLHISGLAGICRHEADAPDFWETFGAAVTAGALKRRLSQKLRMSNGRIVTCQFSTMPDGSTLAAFADVTATETIALALKERNQALEHADEMRSALIDQISHRMRTPLNSIYGFGQILAEQRFGELNASQTEYVDAIVASAGELVDVINEMADLVSVGQDEAESGPLEMSSLLAEVTALASSRFPDRRLNIVCDRPDFVYSGDRLRLRQAIFNLLADAVGHVRADDEIEFALNVREDALALQMRHPAAEKAAGGLALALARRAIAQSGGELEIFDAPGAERVVEAVLPHAPRDEAERPRLAAAGE